MSHSCCYPLLSSSLLVSGHSALLDLPFFLHPPSIAQGSGLVLGAAGQGCFRGAVAIQSILEKGSTAHLNLLSC